MSQKIYQIVTDRILALLQNGVVPWQQPWKTRSGPALPVNLVSGRPYRGINLFLLNSQSFAFPHWLTFRQAHDRGGTVRRGEQGTPIVFWRVQPRTVDNPDREESAAQQDTHDRNRFLLRYYTVFNIEQCDGIKAETSDDELPFDPLPACEAVYANMPNLPHLRHAGEKAFYSLRPDLVQLPRPEAFSSVERYYSTQLHELAHNAEARIMPCWKLTPWDCGAFRHRNVA